MFRWTSILKMVFLLLLMSSCKNTRSAAEQAYIEQQYQKVKTLVNSKNTGLLQLQPFLYKQMR
jgi:hypothetical protein